MGRNSVNPSIRKVLIMAGGTGGHVFPALAVASVLRSRGCQIDWLGTNRGIESSIVPDADIPLHVISIEGIRGKGVFAWIKAPWLLIKAITQAIRIVKQVKPDIVLGFGGFASGPGGVSSRLLRTPLIIHEQNAVAGTTNKILSRVAQRVLEAFPGSLPGAKLVGNPVRKDITQIEEPETRYAHRSGSLNLLVLGGSLGAMAINELIPAVMASMDQEHRPVIRHQAGKAHYEKTLALYKQYDVTARVDPFIENMAEALSWADLVIARSGALTVSELTAVGVASLLIPFPYAIDDHQTKNAEWLVDNGAAILTSQHELDNDTLRNVILKFSNNRQKLREMAIQARKLALPDAAIQVADVCQEVAYG